MLSIRCSLPCVLLMSACGGTSTPVSPPAVAKAAKGVEITLTNVEIAQSIGTMGLVPAAPEGATYVHATYTLKNTGKGALGFEKWPQGRLVDPTGNKFEPEIYSSTALSAAANVSWAESLNPNSTTEGHLVWKVDAKSFDRAKWKIVFQSVPPLTFSLQP